jgi:hypothetical protein
MELILAWRSPTDRRWYPVARIDRDNEKYRLRYVKGMLRSDVARHAVVPGMENPELEYRSDELFPFLKNRIYNRKRSDYGRYRRWLGLDDVEIHDPLAELAVSGGVRATDSYQLFAVPEQHNGRYENTFFIHGSRYVAEEVADGNLLREGDRLLLQLDIQNSVDPGAIALRTDNDEHKVIVGYIPRVMQSDVRTLLDKTEAHAVTVHVSAVSNDAPHMLKHRCLLTAPWPSGFTPYSGPDFQPVAHDRHVAIVA